MPLLLTTILFKEYLESYDVFLLIDRQESENYSPENEELLIEMLRGRVKVIRYADEFDESKYFGHNYADVQNWAQERGLYLDRFVHRLWARRFIINELRTAFEREHDITYDLVIRTRFDILVSGDTRNIRNILAVPVPAKTIYAAIDVFSIGTADAINIESRLGLVFPYMEDLDPTVIPFISKEQWQLSSEYQNILHLKKNGIALISGILNFQIYRRNTEELYGIIAQIQERSSLDGLKVRYGLDGNYTDVTDITISKINSDHVYGEINGIFCCDPFPGIRKRVMITHPTLTTPITLDE